MMRAAWWWIDRWQKSTGFKDLTLAEQGGYRNLLDELWLRDGALPDDERVLAKLCGDALEWPKIREHVLAHFHLVDGMWRNETHDEVQGESHKRATKQKRYRDRKRDSGVDGHVADNVIHNGRDNGRPNVGPSPSPDPDPFVRTTDSLAVARVSLTSGQSVEASVQAPESPLVEMVAAANPDAGWSRDACDAWAERFKGRPPGGQIGRALKPLVQKHGWAAVRPAWRTYLAFSQPEFASAARFAMTYGEWAARAGRPLPL